MPETDRGRVRTAAEDEAVSELARNLPDKPEDAGKTLPKEARESYRDAQRSVVDARRNAETREGLLRIC
jgi:hypothetical protein